MKTGIVRRINAERKIDLPLTILKQLHINQNDALEISIQDGGILLSKYYPDCDFCEDAEGFIQISGKHICGDCMNQLKRIWEGEKR